MADAIIYQITCMYQPLRPVLISKTDCLEMYIFLKTQKRTNMQGRKEHSMDN